MKDLRAGIAASEGTLQKITRYLPGFAGYLDREERRKADQILRIHLADTLAGERERMKRMGVNLIAAGQLEMINDLDRIGKRLETVTDRLRHASYGYGGFFDAVRINTPELDRIYDHDLKLLSGIDALKESLTTLETEIEKGGQAPDPAALSRSIADLAQALEDREEILMGVK